jgi:hypothetical protein
MKREQAAEIRLRGHSVMTRVRLLYPCNGAGGYPPTLLPGGSSVMRILSVGHEILSSTQGLLCFSDMLLL